MCSGNYSCYYSNRESYQPYGYNYPDYVVRQMCNEEHFRRQQAEAEAAAQKSTPETKSEPSPQLQKSEDNATTKPITRVAQQSLQILSQETGDSGYYGVFIPGPY